MKKMPPSPRLPTESKVDFIFNNDTRYFCKNSSISFTSRR